MHSPSRELILHLLQEANEALSIPQLAQAAGMHENTVRAQLEALLRDGYVRRTPAAVTGRGRPPWIWSPAPTPESPYATLARVLARQIAASCADPVSAGLEAGTSWGRELAREQHADSTQDLENPQASAAQRVLPVLRRMGFDPSQAADGQIRLQACPLLGAAREHPEVVCNVHLGIVRGVLGQEADPHPAESTAITPFAGPGYCLLRLDDAQDRDS